MNKKPLHVLQFICPSGFYGAERWILALFKGLNPDRVSCGLAVTTESGDGLEICTEVRSLNLPVHEFSLSHRFDWRVVGKLCSYIRENNIKIVHTHGYKSDIIGVLAARKCGIKAICTPHGFENSRQLKLQFYLWLGGKSFKYFDVVAPLSPRIEEDLKYLYKVPESIIYRIQNGVDLSEVESVKLNTPKKMDSIFRIGYVGQLNSRKNISLMIESFAHFNTAVPDAELCLVGDGEERSALQELAHKLGCAEKVKFLGFRHDRLEVLRQFDVFAMTSTLEGIPRCLMESMAMEVPVTAFDIPGVDQLIMHEQTGMLATLGDCDGLADLWLILFRNEEKRKSLSVAAYEYVNKYFSAKRMASEYTDLYYRV
jgi:glycosyltransferase involved in cell wall biosynthesis